MAQNAAINQLERMSSKQLWELRNNIDAAIRLNIKKSRTPQLSVSEPVKTIDWERDAKAWKTRRTLGPSQ